MADHAERRWYSRDGMALFARDYAGASGEARLPVVCLHGLTRNSKDFEDVAPRLAATGRRVLVPDVRGRGRSDRDPNPENYRIPLYARDMLRLLDALGIGRAVFVGTSMGGLIAMTVATLRARSVEAVVLNDVGPEVGSEGIARILSYAGKPAEVGDWDAAADYVRRIGHAAFPAFSESDWRRHARRTFRDIAGRPAFDYDPLIMAPIARRPVKTRSLAARLMFRLMARRRPTLLIRGGSSDLMTGEIAAAMKRSAPAMREAVVPNVGHAPMLTEPEAVKALDDFLASVR